MQKARNLRNTAWQLRVFAAAISAIMPQGLMTQSYADVTNGNSEAYGLRADVAILGGGLSTTVQAGAETAAAPAGYNTSTSAFSVNVDVSTSISVFGLGLVDVTALGATGLFNSALTSDVDGIAGVRTTTGFSQVTGTGGGVPFSLTVGDTSALLLDPAPLLQITASIIESTSSVSGDHGALSGSGTSLLVGFSVGINGGTSINLQSLLTGAGYALGTDFLVDGTIITPNLSVDLNALGLAGAALIFNRQVSTGDGVTALDFETTALYVDVNSTLPLVGNTLDTTVQVGQSVASQQAVASVPETSSAVSLALGLMALLSRHRRRFC